jgi:hypothetical protein
MKLHKCKACGEAYVKQRQLQKVCSPVCAIKLAKQQVVKEQVKAAAQDRKQTKAKLDAMKGKPQLVREAQTAFNAFIRARDSGKPCISCGTPLPSAQIGGAFDCGHYRSVGSAPHMRFVEDNAHGQCKHCNRHLSGNHVAYRLGLVERIGQRAVDLIEADNTTRKYTHDGLREIAKHYRAETKKFEPKM